MKQKNRTRICLLLIFCMLLPAADTGGSSFYTTASAAAVESSDTYTDTATGYTYALYEKTGTSSTTTVMAKITGYTGENWDLKIPAAVASPTEAGKTIPVGSIGTAAFEKNAAVTSVTIPEGIETIGAQAFNGCENLTAVSLPSSITSWECDSHSVAVDTFRNCTRLKKLELGDGMKMIGGYAFYGCTSLESVRIPSKVNDFYDSAFQNCTSLKKLELPEGIKQMGKNAFKGCTSLTEVTIPSTIISWSPTKHSNIMAPDYECAAFADCSSLSKVTFTEGLTTLSCSNLFQGDCSSLKSVTVPSTVTDLYRAFSRCTYLEEIHIEENQSTPKLEKIASYAFYECNALKKFTIPAAVKEIGESAFEGCTRLESIICPENMTYFSGNRGAFYQCSSLKSVYLLSDTLNHYMDVLPNNSTTVYCLKGSDTWQKCWNALKNDGKTSQLSIIPEVEGITVTAYSGEYDEKSHPAFTLTGTAEDDRVRCWSLKEDGSADQLGSEIPQITEPGIYQWNIFILRKLSGEIPLMYSKIQISTEVRKKIPEIVFGDLTFEENTAYTITPEKYNGTSTIIYRYYTDAQCKNRLSSKPKKTGTYYVTATIEESPYYQGIECEAMKLVITEAGAQVPSTSQMPGTSHIPDASQMPGVLQPPGTSQSPNASQLPNASQSPNVSQLPNASQAPNASQSPNASQAPATLQPPNALQLPDTSIHPPAAQTTDTPSETNPLQTPMPDDYRQEPQATEKPDETVTPKKATIKKVTSVQKRTLQISWNKQPGVTGYQVCIALDQKWKKEKKQVTVKGASRTTRNIKKLKSRKKYYVRVRAYKITGGKKYYGAWSNTKAIKTK